MLLKHSFFINKKQLALFSSALQRRGLISISLLKPSKSRKNSFFAGVLTVMLLLVCEVGWGQTSVTKYAGNGADVSGVGTRTWSNPMNINYDDGNYAEVTVNNGNPYSHYLRGTGFGFSIPASAVISGIEVTIGRYSNGFFSPLIRDVNVYLLKNLTVVGNNKALTNDDWPTYDLWGGGDSPQTYGSSSDLWGTTWTPADINNANFGVVLSVGVNNNRTAYVDYFQIKVTYCTSSPNAPSTTDAVICAGSTATLSASGAASGDRYLWYSEGGTLLKTSTNNTDNTYTTPALTATTNYWVSIRSAAGCESLRTQVTASYPYPPSDSRTSAGTNSWIGHIYDNVNFNNYLGYYTQTEQFRERYGSTGTWANPSNDDASCFNVYSNGSIFGSVRVETFSAEYRMNSTRRGLYYATITSDDGSILYVDGNPVYSDWQQQSPQANNNVLFSLSGNSSMILQYYENAGQNVLGFDNLTQILSNTLNTNINQSVCIGSSGSAISGDVFGTLPGGITLSGTGYQWAYSTSSTGPWTNISGATSATYTPSTTSSPFNVSGTYYIIRKAILSSTNNYLSPTTGTYTATNESNAATITVNALPTAGAPSSNPTLCINTALTAITHTTTGATGIGAATGLPAGVTAAWASASNTITISGTPLESATFDYSIPLTGGCGTVYATGTITVNPTPVVNNYSAYSFCSGEPANIGLKATPSSTFLWSRGDITGIFVNPQPVVGGTSNTIEQTLSIPNNATTGSVEYVVTPTSTAGSCVGASFSITVTVEHPAIGSFE